MAERFPDRANRYMQKSWGRAVLVCYSVLGLGRWVLTGLGLGPRSQYLGKEYLSYEWMNKWMNADLILKGFPV